MPDALVRRPELYPDLEPIAEAFRVLAAARAVAVGPAGTVPQPIPLGEIGAYLAMFGGDWDERDSFVRLLQAMDRVWLDRTADQRSSKALSPTNGRTHQS